MFDMNFYNHIFQALRVLLERHQNKFPQGYANELLMLHDVSRGITPNAQGFYRYCEEQHHRQNGIGATSFRSQDQLFHIVGAYIDWVVEQQRRQQQQQMGGGFGGGFGAPQNNVFGAPAGGGGFGRPNGFHSTPLPQSQSGSIIPASNGGFAQAPAEQPRQQAAPAQQPMAPQVVGYSENPLDVVSEKGVAMTPVTASPNWGLGIPKDNSIVMTKKDAIKTSDDVYVINACTAYARTWFGSPIDVVRNFFDVVPDEFLAEHFIVRVFYNHVEQIDLPTRDFEEVCNKFLYRMDGASVDTTYTAIMAIIGQLPHDHRMAIANYLVKHINRALELSVAANVDPEDRIRFREMEDLKILLGSSFSHPALSIPDGREMVTQVINTAIINALTCYSDAMFSSSNDGTINVIKTSPVFPYSLPGVYPNKNIIPFSGAKTSLKFYESLKDNFLADKTFVRSIRSVIVTNTMGGQYLSKPKELFTQLKGTVPSIFSTFLLDHKQKLPVSGSKCPSYNELPVTQDLDASYESFLQDQTAYIKSEFVNMADWKVPTLPVDQTVFAVQYKRDPKDYLAAFDIGTTLDAEPHSVFFKKSALRDLTLV